uniref:Uncharacterized protein n=1 Tax=Arundo donax TaxID=35708 RepID=A0A0A9CY90_ARUDO
MWTKKKEVALFGNPMFGVLSVNLVWVLSFCLKQVVQIYS